jgi:hypothetical protein
MPQKIFGSAERQLNEVNLAKGPHGVGDSLSVHLAQEPSTGAVWLLQVWVHIDQGTYFLGEISTTPPTMGDLPSRTVLIATCPAATGWKVIATCPNDNEVATLDLDSSKCCTSAIGVRKITPGDSDTSNDPWLNNFSTELDNSFQVYPGRHILRSITVRVDAVIPTGDYYIQIWNADIPPADGTIQSQSNSHIAPEKVQHTLGTDDEVRFDFNENGIPATIGAFICLSTTEFEKTLYDDVMGMSVISAEYRIP